MELHLLETLMVHFEHLYTNTANLGSVMLIVKLELSSWFSYNGNQHNYTEILPKDKGIQRDHIATKRLLS